MRAPLWGGWGRTPTTRSPLGGSLGVTSGTWLAPRGRRVGPHGLYTGHFNGMCEARGVVSRDRGGSVGVRRGSWGVPGGVCVGGECLGPLYDLPPHRGSRHQLSESSQFSGGLGPSRRAHDTHTHQPSVCPTCVCVHTSVGLHTPPVTHQHYTPFILHSLVTHFFSCVTHGVTRYTTLCV